MDDLRTRGMHDIAMLPYHGPVANRCVELFRQALGASVTAFLEEWSR
jgi:hypothetical protein